MLKLNMPLLNTSTLKDLPLLPQDLMMLAGNAFNAGVVAACLTALLTTTPWADVMSCDGESESPANEDAESAESVLDEELISCATPQSE
jgi:alkylated DNA nucleotide flippase Atl1